MYVEKKSEDYVILTSLYIGVWVYVYIYLIDQQKEKLKIRRKTFSLILCDRMKIKNDLKLYIYIKKNS